MAKIITICRQYGSGGRAIGKKTAALLGIPCYDHDVIRKAAEKSGLAEEYIAEHGEYKNNMDWMGDTIAAANSYGGISNGDIIWVVQRKVITDLAHEGPCVIVGRCADYILRDEHDILNAFIYADMGKRIRRIVDVYHEGGDSPEKALRKKDKQRAAYYRYYTDIEWGDMQNYAIMLNSGEIGIDKCAEILADLYKLK